MSFFRWKMERIRSNVNCPHDLRRCYPLDTLETCRICHETALRKKEREERKK